MPKYLKYGIIFGIVDFALLDIYAIYEYYIGKGELLDVYPSSLGLLILVVSYFVLKRREH